MSMQSGRMKQLGLDKALGKLWAAQDAVKDAVDTAKNVASAPKRKAQETAQRVREAIDPTSCGKIGHKLPKGKKRGRGTNCEKCGIEML